LATPHWNSTTTIIIIITLSICTHAHCSNSAGTHPDPWTKVNPAVQAAASHLQLRRQRLQQLRRQLQRDLGRSTRSSRRRRTTTRRHTHLTLQLGLTATTTTALAWKRECTLLFRGEWRVDCVMWNKVFMEGDSYCSASRT
jgi:hypothetical protein